MRKKKTNRRNLAIAAVVLLGIIIVGGYILLSGGGGGGNGGECGNGETITSIDFKLKGFKAGSLGPNVRYRAKELGTESAKLRIDKIGAEDILIFNYDENAEYAYTGSSWLKFSITQNDPYAGLSEKIQEWAQQGKGTYDVTYEEISVEIEIDNVNPLLDDNLFTPPENADVEELETG